MAVVARSFGLVWTLNPLQILYVDDGTDVPSTSERKDEKERGGIHSGGRKSRAKVAPGPVERQEGASERVSERGRFAYGHATLKGHLLVSTSVTKVVKVEVLRTKTVIMRICSADLKKRTARTFGACFLLLKPVVNDSYSRSMSATLDDGL